MNAYLISQSEVKDPEAHAAYRRLAQSSILHHGGRYLVRGARAEIVEADWPAPPTLTVVEFSDLDAARTWYASPQYAQALAFRSDAMSRLVCLASGVT